ncbi:MAG TPA: hypothetical protein VJZ31_03190 [Bacilli bacterium]|nr:hypothetical protein [Bacilli bacterium]
MAKKIRPELSKEQKKHLAYTRKKGILIVFIIALVALIGVEVVLLIGELIKLAG